MDTSLVWIPATLIASCGQVARNTMQRRLTESIGTVGAAQVRFLYGFPFSLLFLAAVLAVSGESLPGGGPGFRPFLLLGAVTQVLATVLMLAAMRERSFSVVTALVKTEPIQLALYGLVVLGDRVSPLTLGAILVATAGVILVGWTPRIAGEMRGAGLRPVLFGLAAGAMFALSAIGFRGAILALDGGSFVVRSTAALAASLLVQTAILLAYLLVFDRGGLVGSLRVWRRSLLAGLTGAGTSQFWFIGFAVTAAANVRTLALVEVLLAQAVSRRLFQQVTPKRELGGIALILAGVAILLATAR